MGVEEIGNGHTRVALTARLGGTARSPAPRETSALKNNHSLLKPGPQA